MFWYGVMFGFIFGAFVGFALVGWFMFLKLKQQLEKPMDGIMGDMFENFEKEEK